MLFRSTGIHLVYTTAFVNNRNRGFQKLCQFTSTSHPTIVWAIENAGTLEVYKLEKNTAILATIAGAGPMIGFLGTVVGMIMSFHEMASAGGQAEMGALAGGIYTAMATTVAGLIVGIIAYVGYNHLVVKTDKVVHLMEANAVEFLDLLNEPL